MSSKSKSKRTVDGMLFIHEQSRAHFVQSVAKVADVQRESLLDSSELEALDGGDSPAGALYGQGVPA